MTLDRSTSDTPLSPCEVVRVESRALEELARRLDGPMSKRFSAALDLLQHCAEGHHRIIVTGVGKSGLISRKIAATLCSIGVPAHFLHPSDALHGDLGMISAGDVLLALSSSGRTSELLALLPIAKRLGASIITLCGSESSDAAMASDIFLDASVSEEACPHNLVPTASTTVAMALGDALAMCLSSRRGFSPHDFADLHPGGGIGQRLVRVRDRMHRGADLPAVTPANPISEVIYEMSRKKLGMTTVIDRENRSRLLGMISDGDLRRLLGAAGADAFSRCAGDVMNTAPVTIGPDTFATEAIALMEQRKITSLIVVEHGIEVRGVVHLHDLWDAIGRSRPHDEEGQE